MIRSVFTFRALFFFATFRLLFVQIPSQFCYGRISSFVVCILCNCGRQRIPFSHSAMYNVFFLCKLPCAPLILTVFNLVVLLFCSFGCKSLSSSLLSLMTFAFILKVCTLCRFGSFLLEARACKLKLSSSVHMFLFWIIKLSTFLWAVISLHFQWYRNRKHGTNLKIQWFCLSNIHTSCSFAIKNWLIAFLVDLQKLTYFNRIWLSSCSLWNEMQAKRRKKKREGNDFVKVFHYYPHDTQPNSLSPLSMWIEHDMCWRM